MDSILMPTLLSHIALFSAPSRHALRCLTTASTVLPTVHRGNIFEERSLKVLQDHLSMSLRRVGGKSDGGIDLLGWWWLPPSDPEDAEPDGTSNSPRRRRLRVLAQCKAEKKKTSPKYVREMEGVLHRYIALTKHQSSPSLELASGGDSPPILSQHPLVALLVSESPFTKSTILRAQSSPVPFFLLYIPPVADPGADDGLQAPSQIGMAVWNPALAGVRGLLGGKMEARWERSIHGSGRPGLWWNGQRLKSWTPDITSGDNELSMTEEDKFFEGLAEEELLISAHTSEQPSR